MASSGERDSRRSVKIGESERGAYSSDRSRRGELIPEADRQRSDPVRRARGRRLAPNERLSYAPASLIVLAGATGSGTEAFVDRLFEKGMTAAVLSLSRTRRMIPGGGEEAEAQALSLIGRVAEQRLAAGQAVVVEACALDPAHRRELVVVAQRARRPAHLIFLDASREQLAQAGADEEAIERDLPLAATLRRVIDQGTLGEEGFATVLTLTRRAADQVRQISFDLDLRTALE